jgi:hypothetical protein
MGASRRLMGISTQHLGLQYHSWDASAHRSSTEHQDHGETQGSFSLSCIRPHEFGVSLFSMPGLASHRSSNGCGRIRCQIANATLHMSQALHHGADCALRWSRPYKYTLTSRCTRTVTPRVDQQLDFRSLSSAFALYGLRLNFFISLPFA